MKIEMLTLFQFRNYQTLEFYPHESLTVLFGDNAQGKTNILETILLCATGRSHRTTHDAQMIQHHANSAYISLRVKQKRFLRYIEMRMLKNRGKQIKIDGAPIARMGELMGCFNAVLFSPEDLRLVKDGPAERRRFLDMEISQMTPAYFYALSNYMRANQNRNALLKSLQNHHGDFDQLNVWDEQLALYGAQIYAQRRTFMQLLNTMAADVHHQLSNAREILKLTYESDIKAETEEEATVYIEQMLKKQRDEDIRRGATQRGIHRDDIGLLLNDLDARAYASQGQQRTIALSMKISELHLIHQETNQAPVFLLDDVFSELDTTRQNMLLQTMKNYQTILTTNHWDNDCSILCDRYQVSHGVVEKK